MTLTWLPTSNPSRRLYLAGNTNCPFEDSVLSIVRYSYFLPPCKAIRKRFAYDFAEKDKITDPELEK